MNLGPNERYVGKKIANNGYEYFIGIKNQRGATKVVKTDLLGQVKEIKELAKPSIENLKANCGIF